MQVLSSGHGKDACRNLLLFIKVGQLKIWIAEKMAEFPSSSIETLNSTSTRHSPGLSVDSY